MNTNWLQAAGDRCQSVSIVSCQSRDQNVTQIVRIAHLHKWYVQVYLRVPVKWHIYGYIIRIFSYVGLLYSLTCAAHTNGPKNAHSLMREMKKQCTRMGKRPCDYTISQDTI